MQQLCRRQKLAGKLQPGPCQPEAGRRQAQRNGWSPAQMMVTANQAQSLPCMLVSFAGAMPIMMCMSSSELHLKSEVAPMLVSIACGMLVMMLM